MSALPALVAMIGLATVAAAEVVHGVAARQLARRTGRAFWRCHLAGWEREPVRGIPAMAWWLGIAALGMAAFATAPAVLRWIG